MTASTRTPFFNAKTTAENCPANNASNSATSTSSAFRRLCNVRVIAQVPGSPDSNA